MLLSHFNLDQTPFCKNEFVYRKPVSRKLHPIISPCKYEMFYRKGAVHLYHAAMRHSVKKTTPLKVDLVWSNCSRFIYHKEMNTTNMTFAAPSLQLRSNTFFHSYEFEYRKPVLNRRSRSFFQTGTFSKKKRYPFILCYNGRHYSNIEDAKTEVWTTVLMYLPFFTQIVQRNAAWQYYN